MKIYVRDGKILCAIQHFEVDAYKEIMKIDKE